MGLYSWRSLLNNASKSNNPYWWVTIFLYYLLFLLPSLYALAALTELDIKMGPGNGFYYDYGRNAGEVALATAFTAIYALWIIFGTIATIRVFKGEWGLHRLGLLAAVATFVMFPVAIGFLLGVGHP